MGIFGRRRERGQPHPRKEPVFDGPLTAENLTAAFANSIDLKNRTIHLAGDPQKEVRVFGVDGMVRTERANDYVLRPLAQDRDLVALPLEACYDHLASGAIYNFSVSPVETMDDAVFALLDGAVVLLFPAIGKALSCAVATEEKRSIGDPQDEPAVKASKDSFVESVRTNTSLVRRRMRSVDLRVEEEVVGRQTRTPVDLLYLDGIADPETVAQVRSRLRDIDVDGALDAGHLEQYLCDTLATPFPQFWLPSGPTASAPIFWPGGWD